MHKFIRVIPFTDPITKGVAKEIQTTAGNCYSKTCAYNQFMLRNEKIAYTNTKDKLNGPPICIFSIKYRLHKKEGYENIKDVTRSRKENTLLYKIEVGRIKKRLEENTNFICIFNFLFFNKEWLNLNEEDIITIIQMQIDAGVIYITVPTFPDAMSEKN